MGGPLGERQALQQPGVAPACAPPRPDGDALAGTITRRD